MELLLRLHKMVKGLEHMTYEEKIEGTGPA